MKKRYRAKITAAGCIYVLITIILGVGAVNTGNNLLYLMSSLLLALMVISGMSSLGNLFFLTTTLIPPGEIYAGIPARFRLRLEKKRGRSFFLTGATPFGSGRVPFLQGSSETDLWLTFPERGKGRVEELGIHSGFPLGFFRRTKTVPLGLEVLVYPRPLARIMPPLGGVSRGSEAGRAPRGEQGDEIKELRDYRSSDPMKWVDWKSSARKGALVVREFYRLQGDRLTLDLSRRDSHWERRVSEACHLVIEGERNRLSLVLLLPEGTIGPGSGPQHRRRLLEALALA